MSKVLFIVKKKIDYGTGVSYGTAYGLGNSANFVSSFLNSYGIDSKVAVVDDGNDIDRVVTEYDPDFVVIEAIWVTPEKLLELFSFERHQRRHWSCRIHSRLSFIAQESHAFPWLLRYRDEVASKYDFVIAPNIKEFEEDLSKFYKMKTAFLPNIYEPGAEPLPNYEYPEDNILDFPDASFCKKRKSPKHLDMGCFGAVRPLKNHLTQGMAAIEFAEDLKMHLRFHINVQRAEQGGDSVVKNLRALFAGTDHELVEHDWLQHAAFVALIKQMDIGCQVSLSESFNLVAADFIHEGIPFLGSAQIRWLPGVCQVTDPNLTQQIREGLHTVWRWRHLGLAQLCKLALNQHNKKAEDVWLDYLS